MKTNKLFLLLVVSIMCISFTSASFGYDKTPTEQETTSEINITTVSGIYFIANESIFAFNETKLNATIDDRAGGGGGGGNTSWNESHANTLYIKNNTGGWINNFTTVQIQEFIANGGNMTWYIEEHDNDMHMHFDDLGGSNYFGIATTGSFFQLYANPNPSNDYLLATITETQGTDTELNFYEGGTGHNRFWSSGSVRIGGNAGYQCTQLTDIDCDTPLTGADLEVQDDIWSGGKIFASDWSNISITESQISDLTPSSWVSDSTSIYNLTSNIAIKTGVGTDGLTVRPNILQTSTGNAYYNITAGANKWAWLTAWSGSTGNIQLLNTNNDLEVITFEAGGNIGIGTSTPNKKLDIDGSMNLTGDLYVKDIFSFYSPFGRISVRDSSGGTGLLIDGDGALTSYPNDFILRTRNHGSIKFSNYTSNNMMTLLGEGLVGIGTETPNKQLEIHSSNSDTEVLINGSVGNGNYYDSRLYFETYDNTGIIELPYFPASGTGNLNIRGSKGVFITRDTTGAIGTSTGANALYVEGNQTMDGAFLMGVSSSNSIFHYKNAKRAGFKIERSVSVSTGEGVSVVSKCLTSASSTNGFGCQYVFSNEDSSGVEYEISAFGGIRDGADNSGAITFNTASGGSMSRAMTIKSSNLIGMGTSAPAYRLELQTSSAGALLRLDNSAGQCDATPSAGALTWSCSSDELLKTNIRNINDSEILQDLKARLTCMQEYEIIETNETTIGSIAQCIQEIRPDMVKNSTSLINISTYINDEGFEVENYSGSYNYSHLMVDQPNTNELLVGIGFLHDRYKEQLEINEVAKNRLRTIEEETCLLNSAFSWC